VSDVILISIQIYEAAKPSFKTIRNSLKDFKEVDRNFKKFETF